MSTPISVVDLDFGDIKAAIQAFLSTQTEFTDYNFDGSALSVLTDLLAYNTHYNALLASLQSNEQFLDTAIKRSSVVSLAKTLGYIPRSTTSAIATLNIVVTPVGLESILVLNTTDKFTTSMNGVSYTFQPITTHTATKQNGVFTFANVDVIEGGRLQNSFVVNSDTVSGPFIIPVNVVDVSTLLVTVQNSVSDLTVKVFTKSDTVIGITDTSTVFWVEENSAGNYQVVFGDNIIGKSLVAGNIVTMSYLASNGSAPNGAQIFSPTGAISGEINVAITTINAASVGDEKETIDSIRFHAPKFNATKDRVVTAQDYKSLILSNMSKAKSVVVWGGEENTPPIYGKVFITIDPKKPYVITQNDKNFLLDQVIQPRSVMSIQHEFVDPEYLYLGFNVKVSYNAKITNFTANQIEILVITAIQNYFAYNLSTLDRTFYLSQFVDALVASNPSILGILVDMTIQNRITKLSSFNTTKNLRFLASLVAGSVSSTVFVASVNGITYNAYMQDYANDAIPNPIGQGTIKLLQKDTGVVLVPNLGTIDYGLGVISFSDLIIQSYLGNISDVRINATPQDWSKNISSSFVTLTESTTFAVLPQPARNIIIQLDDSTTNQSIQMTAGVTVTSTPIVDNA